jgi:hypothetical protein
MAHPFGILYNALQPHNVCISGRSHSVIAVLVLRDIQGYSKWLSGFQQLVIHNTLGMGVCSCTDESRNSQSFLLWCAVCSSYAFLHLERSLLRRRRTAIETIPADMVQTVWNELDYRVDVCRITKGTPVRYVTKTWIVVLLNKKIHILLSQVHCVWQVVKTPTIIFNNPVCSPNLNA